MDCQVTPFAGVWIETCCTPTACPGRNVTPFPGVWIETRMAGRISVAQLVTPFAGVWIETREGRPAVGLLGGHALRGRVD